MKIAYLANVRYPSERAHSVQISHTCQAFVERGAEVTLFANRRTEGDIVTASDYYGFSLKFSLLRVNHVFFSPRIRLSYYLSELFYSLNFLFFINIRKFDFFYSRHEWVLWFLSFFINSKKLVWESHEAHFSLPARRILKKGVKTVVISEGIFDFYTEKSFPGDQFIIAHDAIDDSFFEKLESSIQAKKRLGICHGEKVVMYIGSFDKWKGIETFLFSSTLCPDKLFAVIGGYQEQILEYKKKFPAVMFIGSRPYSELKDNQQAADVLVIPNTNKNFLSSRYTSPLKLFAHMSSGVPIVASNVPSIRNVVGDGLVTFFEADDYKNLANSIEEVFKRYPENMVKAEKLKTYSKEFTWNNRASKIINFLNKE